MTRFIFIFNTFNFCFVCAFFHRFYHIWTLMLGKMRANWFTMNHKKILFLAGFVCCHTTFVVGFSRFVCVCSLTFHVFVVIETWCSQHTSSCVSVPCCQNIAHELWNKIYHRIVMTMFLALFVEQHFFSIGQKDCQIIKNLCSVRIASRVEYWKWEGNRNAWKFCDVPLSLHFSQTAMNWSFGENGFKITTDVSIMKFFIE